MKKTLALSGNDLNIDDLSKISKLEVHIALGVQARANMEQSRNYIQKRIDAGDTMYGVNTGFGAFSSVKISKEELEELQFNLIRSHCVGVGEPFSVEQSRAIMALRANALATGKSGIRTQVVDKILEFLNADIIPVIPQQGSVGASGDLAPLSHLALALIGEGEVWQNGQRKETSQVLADKKVQALVLQAKEGLSLINGCQVMTAVGMLAAKKIQEQILLSDIAGCMTLEAMRGSRSAFDPLISATRKHPGEAKTARNLNKILGASSEIAKSHENCDRVQDAYSLRCMPAVHGAVKDALNRTIETLEIESNSSTDNPLVFAEQNKILSCGNFHGEPVAFVLDYLAIAMTAMSSISECRIEKLINPAMSGLPAFLASNGGLNSGMMIVQVAAAALVSENKIYAHPASVDSIPTSADKEDHVSMGTIAARKLNMVVDNAEKVLAMELLCAAQALDFLAPLRASAGVKAAHDFIRKTVPFASKDRVFAKDIESIRQMIRSGDLLQCVQQATGELEC